jgi:hypothetical protein
MTEIFHRMYELRVKRQLAGTHAQFALVTRHYIRLAAMYGAEYNFGIGPR